MRSDLLKWMRDFLEKRIHAQEPAAIFPSSKFPWSLKFESRHLEIKREAEGILDRRREIINFDEVLKDQRALVQLENWKSFFLIALGEDVPAHQEICPQTTAVLKSVHGVINAFFSILAPGTEIPSHRGPYAGVLRYHFGVIVPSGDVAIRVDDILCRWKEGASLFFDDSFPHEAWNRTSGTRVVLFVDLIRPLPWRLAVWNRLILLGFEFSKEARAAQRRVLRSQLSLRRSQDESL